MALLRRRPRRAWIAAIVVPAFVLIVLAGLLLLFFLKWRRRRRLNHEERHLGEQDHDLANYPAAPGHDPSMEASANRNTVPGNRATISQPAVSQNNVNPVVPAPEVLVYQHPQGTTQYNSQSPDNTINSPNPGINRYDQQYHAPEEQGNLGNVSNLPQAVTNTYKSQSRPVSGASSTYPSRKSHPNLQEPGSSAGIATSDSPIDTGTNRSSIISNSSANNLDLPRPLVIYPEPAIVNEAGYSNKTFGTDPLTDNTLVNGAADTASHPTVNKPVTPPALATPGFQPQAAGSRTNSIYGSFIGKIIPLSKRQSTTGFRYENMGSPNLAADLYYASEKAPKSAGTNQSTSMATAGDTSEKGENMVKSEPFTKNSGDASSSSLPITRDASGNSIQSASSVQVSENHQNSFPKLSRNSLASVSPSSKSVGKLKSALKEKLTSRRNSSTRLESNDNKSHQTIEFKNFEGKNNQGSEEMPDSGVGLGIESRKAPSMSKELVPAVSQTKNTSVGAEPPVINIEFPRYSLRSSSIYSDIINFEPGQEDYGSRHRYSKSRSRSQSRSRNRAATLSSRENSFKSSVTDRDYFKLGGIQQQMIAAATVYDISKSFSHHGTNDGAGPDNYSAADLESYQKKSSSTASTSSLPRIVSVHNGPPRISFTFHRNSSIFDDYFESGQASSRTPSVAGTTQYSSNLKPGPQPQLHGDNESNNSSSYSGLNTAFMEEYGPIISKYNTNYSSSRVSSHSNSAPGSRRASRASEYAASFSRIGNTYNDNSDPIPPLPINIPIPKGSTASGFSPTRRPISKSVKSVKPERPTEHSNGLKADSEANSYLPLHLSSSSISIPLLYPTQGTSSQTNHIFQIPPLQFNSNGQTSQPSPLHLDQPQSTDSSPQSPKYHTPQAGYTGFSPLASTLPKDIDVESLAVDPETGFGSSYISSTTNSEKFPLNETQATASGIVTAHDLGHNSPSYTELCRESLASMESMKTARSLISKPMSSYQDINLTTPPIPPYATSRSRSSSTNRSHRSVPANICADESPEREGLEAANFSSSDDSPVDTAASSAPTEYQSAISLRSFGFDEQIPPVPLVTELHFSSSTESLFLDDVYPSSRPTFQSSSANQLSQDTSSLPSSNKIANSTGLKPELLEKTKSHGSTVSSLVTATATHQSLDPYASKNGPDITPPASSTRNKTYSVNSLEEFNQDFEESLDSAYDGISHSTTSPHDELSTPFIYQIPGTTSSTHSNIHNQSNNKSNISILTGGSHDSVISLQKSNSSLPLSPITNDGFVENGFSGVIGLGFEQNSSLSSAAVNASTLALAPSPAASVSPALKLTPSSFSSLPSSNGSPFEITSIFPASTAAAVAAGFNPLYHRQGRNLLQKTPPQHSSSTSMFSTGSESSSPFKSLKIITVRDDESYVHITDAEESNFSGDLSSTSGSLTKLSSTFPPFPVHGGFQQPWGGGQPMSHENTITLDQKSSFALPIEDPNDEVSNDGISNPSTDTQVSKETGVTGAAVMSSVPSTIDTPQIMEAFFPPGTPIDSTVGSVAPSPALSSSSMVAAVTAAGAAAAAARSGPFNRSRAAARIPMNIEEGEESPGMHKDFSELINSNSPLQHSEFQRYPDTTRTNPYLFGSSHGEIRAIKSLGDLSHDSVTSVSSKQKLNAKSYREAIASPKTPIKSEQASIISVDAGMGYPSRYSSVKSTHTVKNPIGLGVTAPEPTGFVGRSKSSGSITSSLKSCNSVAYKVSLPELHKKRSGIIGRSAATSASLDSGLDISSTASSPLLSSSNFGEYSYIDNSGLNRSSSIANSSKLPPSIPPMPSNVLQKELAVTMDGSKNISQSSQHTISQISSSASLLRDPKSAGNLHRASMQSISSVKSAGSDSTVNSVQISERRTSLHHRYSIASSLYRGAAESVVSSLSYNSATGNVDVSTNQNQIANESTQNILNKSLGEVAKTNTISSRYNSPVPSTKSPNTQQGKFVSSFQGIIPGVPVYSQSSGAISKNLSFYSAKSGSVDSELEKSWIANQPSLLLQHQQAFVKSATSLSSGTSLTGSVVSGISSSASGKTGGRKHTLSKEAMKYINATKDLPPPPSSTLPNAPKSGLLIASPSAPESSSQSGSGVDSGQLKLMSPQQISVPVSRSSSDQSSASIISQYRKLPSTPYEYQADGASQMNAPVPCLSTASSSLAHSYPAENIPGSLPLPPPIFPASSGALPHDYDGSSPSESSSNIAGNGSPSLSNAFMTPSHTPLLDTAASGSLSTPSSSEQNSSTSCSDSTGGLHSTSHGDSSSSNSGFDASSRPNLLQRTSDRINFSTEAHDLNLSSPQTRAFPHTRTSTDLHSALHGNTDLEIERKNLEPFPDEPVGRKVNSIISQTSNYNDEDSNDADDEQLYSRVSFESSAESGGRISPNTYQSLVEMEGIRPGHGDVSNLSGSQFQAPIHSNIPQVLPLFNTTSPYSSYNKNIASPHPRVAYPFVSLDTPPNIHQVSMTPPPPPPAMPFQLRSQYNPHELFLLHEEEGESEAEAQAAAEAAARKEQEKAYKRGISNSPDIVASKQDNTNTSFETAVLGPTQARPFAVKDGVIQVGDSVISSGSSSTSSQSPSSVSSGSSPSSSPDIITEEHHRQQSSDTSEPNRGLSHQSSLVGSIPESQHELRSEKSFNMSISSSNEFMSVGQGPAKAYFPGPQPAASFSNSSLLARQQQQYFVLREGPDGAGPIIPNLPHILPMPSANSSIPLKPSLSSSSSSGSKVLNDAFIFSDLKNNLKGMTGRNDSSVMTASSTTTGASTSSSSDFSNNIFSVEVFRVVHEYKPLIDDELELVPGDLLVVLYEFDDGWCFARLVSLQQASAPSPTTDSQSASSSGHDNDKPFVNISITPTNKGGRILEGVCPRACISDAPLSLY